MNLSAYILEHFDMAGTADPVVLSEIANDKGMSSAEEHAYNSRYDFLAKPLPGSFWRLIQSFLRTSFTMIWIRLKTSSEWLSVALIAIR